MNKWFYLRNNRVDKAKKIQAVLENYTQWKIAGLRILDIWCGNWEIAGYFVREGNIVTWVDMENKLENDDLWIHFETINNEKIPFQDESFDVVISNHVVEHVTDAKYHLSEIYRVLKKWGILYFATPNRNFFIEPHYNIPFIHYFWDTIFHKILKILWRYSEDLGLLSYNEQKKLLGSFFGEMRDYTPDVIKEYAVYHFNKIPVISALPYKILTKISCLSQTNIFICKK